MNVTKLDSGVLVASRSQPAQPPAKEHDVLKDIRDRLEGLESDLDCYEQTTHGHIGPNTIEHLAQCLVECYTKPSAYTISNLSQVIRGFLKEHK